MIWLTAALVLLGLLIAVIYRKDDTPVTEAQGDCATCDGTNEKCEQECMMEAATKDIEYYDDEELDVYRGKASDAYTDEEAEQFREVMYTMRQEEVAGWNRSLLLRQISVPDQIKDELVMLIGG